MNEERSTDEVEVELIGAWLQTVVAGLVTRPADVTDLLPLVRAYYRFGGIRFRKDTATAIGRLIANRSHVSLQQFDGQAYGSPWTRWTERDEKPSTFRGHNASIACRSGWPTRSPADTRRGPRESTATAVT